VTQRTEAAAIRFGATLSTIGTSTVVRLPETASKKLPSRGQVAVRGTINGVGFQTVLEPDGNSGHWMRVDDTLRPGLAFMTLHFPDQVETNILTLDTWDPKSGTAEFKATAIRVEKATPEEAAAFIERTRAAEVVS